LQGVAKCSFRFWATIERTDRQAHLWEPSAATILTLQADAVRYRAIQLATLCGGTDRAEPVGVFGALSTLVSTARPPTRRFTGRQILRAGSSPGSRPWGICPFRNVMRGVES
jgi:hypothetical protein